MFHGRPQLARRVALPGRQRRKLRVPDILRQVLKEYSGLKFQDQLQADNYRPRDYCVQYRETDFHFANLPSIPGPSPIIVSSFFSLS